MYVVTNYDRAVSAYLFYDNNASERQAIGIGSPDLMIEEVTVPATAIVGQPLTVTWTGKNLGNRATLTGWHGRVVLSQDGVYGNQDDRQLGTRHHNAILEAGGLYSESLQVQIPGDLQGEYRIFVISDGYNQVAEYPDNLSSVSFPVPIRITGPDLGATDLTVPDSYTLSREVILPQVVGHYHILVASDLHQTLAESSDSNNWKASERITIQAPYRATVSTEIERAFNGTPIPLSGEARRPDDTPAANVPVSIRILTRNTRRQAAGAAAGLGLAEPGLPRHPSFPSAG